MYKLETPENVAVAYPIAGVGSRFLALLVDTLIQLGVVLALAIVTFVLARITGAQLSATVAYAIAAVGVFIISIGLLVGYFAFFEILWNGQTPGKRVMKLRVIQTSGYPVTASAVLIRNVLRLVDILPTSYAVGVISMIVTRNARRLGDLAAGTIVVKEGREGPLSALPAMADSGAADRPSGAAPPLGLRTTGDGGDGAAAEEIPRPYGIDVGRLTREDEAIVRDFLARRHTLAPARRTALAQRIANAVHSRVGGETASFTAEGYLELVYRLARDTRDARL